jgi:hypothetical protein
VTATRLALPEALEVLSSTRDLPGVYMTTLRRGLMDSCQKLADRRFRRQETERMDDDEFISISDGEVRAWIEQGESVHMKAVTRDGDPVELSVGQARRLAQSLLKLVARIEAAES